MLGFEMLQAKKTFEIKEPYSNKKFQFKEGNLYLARPMAFWDIRIYDEKKDGIEFIQNISCMGPRHPYYKDYFNIIDKGQVSNKKVFTKMLDIVTKKEYLEEGENNYGNS